MTNYTFFRHSGEATPAFEVGWFEFEEMAIAYGELLLVEHPKAAAIEIYEVDRQIARLDRLPRRPEKA